MNKIIGIDLGTTNSCVAVMEAGKTIIIPNDINRIRLETSSVYYNTGVLLMDLAKCANWSGRMTFFHLSAKMNTSFSSRTRMSLTHFMEN